MIGTCREAIRAEWLEDGRGMRLLSDYAYTDPAGVVWLAPAGATVDGASIPRFLWSLIGGPFEGRYRKASVVHDVACVGRTRPWPDVHRMFYDAMRCSGVASFRARLMYRAVEHFGPRWGEMMRLGLLAEPEPPDLHRDDWDGLAALLADRDARTS